MTVTKWLSLVRQCLMRRMSVSEFGSLLRDCKEIDGKQLFSALVECRASFCVVGDPLISLYLDHIGCCGLVSISDALLALIGKWNATKTPLAQNLLDCYSQSLQDLTMLVVSPKHKTKASEAYICLMISARWLSSVVRALPHDLADSSTVSYTNVIEALGFLIASIAATDGGLEALSNADVHNKASRTSTGRDLRESLRNAFELCLPLYSTLSAQLMERVNTVLKHISLIDDGSSQNEPSSAHSSTMQALHFQVSIPESQMVASKPATILYLEALVRSPLLMTRTQLTTAAFDRRNDR